MSDDPTQLILLAQGQPQPQGSLTGLMVPMILMVVIFYFLLIRPQQKKAKEHTKMVDSLKSGDSVVTRGGVATHPAVASPTRSRTATSWVYSDARSRLALRTWMSVESSAHARVSLRPP